MAIQTQKGIEKTLIVLGIIASALLWLGTIGVI